MFDSVLKNKIVLRRLQMQGRREPDLWTVALHFTANDFAIMHTFVDVMKPVRDATII